MTEKPVIDIAIHSAIDSAIDIMPTGLSGCSSGAADYLYLHPVCRHHFGSFFLEIWSFTVRFGVERGNLPRTAVE